jgi:hypothetical protein
MSYFLRRSFVFPFGPLLCFSFLPQRSFSSIIPCFFFFSFTFHLFILSLVSCVTLLHFFISSSYIFLRILSHSYSVFHSFNFILSLLYFFVSYNSLILISVLYCLKSCSSLQTTALKCFYQ